MPSPDDARAGTVEARSPGWAQGRISLDWLLERRQRAETALAPSWRPCYVLGVHARRMEKLVEFLRSPGSAGRRSA